MRYLLVVFTFFIMISVSAQEIDNLLGFITTKDKKNIEIINQAVAAYNRADYKQGLKLLKKKMKKDAAFYDGYLFMAYGEVQIKKNQKAVELLNKGISIEPKIPIGYFLRGNVYLDMKHYRLALRDYKKCIKLDPQFYPAYNNLALIRVFNQGKAKPVSNDFEMARKDLSLLLSCDEDKSGIEEIYFNLGLVNLQLNKYYEATCFFSKAVASEKIRDKCVYYNAVSKFHIKLYKEAEIDFKTAQKNNFRSDECEKYLSLIKLIINHNNE